MTPADPTPAPAPRTLTREERDIIRKRADAATEGPWVWWTSNSWRRLKSWQDANVAEPCEHRTDHHPDLIISERNMEFIAAARADIPALLFTCDALERDRDALAAEVARLREALDDIAYKTGNSIARAALAGKGAK